MFAVRITKFCRYPNTRQTVDLVDVGPDTPRYHFPRSDKLSGIPLADENGVLNITLRWSGLTADVNAILSCHLIMTDDSLELIVSITWSKNGVVYRKLRDRAHYEVISKNRLNLFCPSNISNYLCFTICLAHHLDM